MAWYAIRTVYAFKVKDDGTHVFEERVVVFEAQSWDQAIDKARIEADIYAAENAFEMHPEQAGYEQDGGTLIDGYEVWSELFESRLALDEFYARRYADYEYHPDHTAAH
jgi:hypothetical protein